MRVRVLVYNVKAFRLGVRNAATLIAQHGPDVALLQECGPRYRLHRFARALGMEQVSTHFLFRRSIHDAVLVRPPWRVISHRLHRFPKDLRFYPRGALIARLGRSGHRLWAISTHLGLSPAARRRNADELVSRSLALDGPVVAGGDLNEGPDGKAVTWLSSKLRDAWTDAGEGPGETFRADVPRARIDYLFVGEGVEVERAVVLRGPEAAAASDHLPLFVDVIIGAIGQRADE
jgi:endonuclease/exonuclease/phosphatase family metal-dependent hydrolase